MCSWGQLDGYAGQDPRIGHERVNYHLIKANSAFLAAIFFAWRGLHPDNPYHIRATKKWARFAEEALCRPDVAYCLLKRVVKSAPGGGTEAQRAELESLLRQEPSFSLFPPIETQNTPKDRIAFSLTNGGSYPLIYALKENHTHLISANDRPFAAEDRRTDVLYIMVRIGLSSPVAR